MRFPSSLTQNRFTDLPSRFRNLILVSTSEAREGCGVLSAGSRLSDGVFVVSATTVYSGRVSSQLASNPTSLMLFSSGVNSSDCTGN